MKSLLTLRDKYKIIFKIEKYFDDKIKLRDAHETLI